MVSRVHWFLWNLDKEIKREYFIKYDYVRHSYLLYRMTGSRLYDCFIIVRTSKHCFRVMYANCETLDIQYFSCLRSVNVARRVWYIYQADKKRKSGDYGNLPP